MRVLNSTVDETAESIIFVFVVTEYHMLEDLTVLYTDADSPIRRALSRKGWISADAKILQPFGMGEVRVVPEAGAKYRVTIPYRLKGA